MKKAALQSILYTFLQRIYLLPFLIFTVTASYSNNRYKVYDVRSGLSGNCIRSIVQDSIGYMWFASQDGLNRFNGYEFTCYGNSSEDKSSEYMNIVKIYKHKDNRHLWVACIDKLYLFDTFSEKFIHFKESTSSGQFIVSPFALCYDSCGKLWIGATNGLFIYDDKKNTLRQYIHKDDDSTSIPNNHIWTVYNDFSNNIWIGTKNGLACYNRRKDNFINYKGISDNTDVRGNNEFLSILEDKQGQIWAGTWNAGLAKIDKSTKTVNYIFGEDESFSIPRIRVLFQKDVKSFYIGSDDGLYIYNVFTKECLLVDEQYHQSIYDFYKDRENGLWIGTYFGGVNYFSPKKDDFEWFYKDNSNNSLSGNIISQFCEDEHGNMWIATEDGGLNYMNVKNKKITKYLLEDGYYYHNVHALLYDNGLLWVGSFSRGLYVMNTRNKSTKNYRHQLSSVNSIPNDHIYSIYKSSKGIIYIGTLSGFCSYDAKNDSFNNLSQLKNIFIYDITEDKYGNLWLASKRDGVWRYNPQNGTLKNYRHKNDEASICSNWVIRAYRDHKDNIWFCTEGGGISRYNYASDDFINYGLKNNLPNSIIYGIIDDESGNYWLSSNRGIIRYDPNNESAQLYTVDDGIQGNQFNFRSSFQSKDGKIYFGGVNGLNCFYPFMLTINKVHPNVSISSVVFHRFKNEINENIKIPVFQGRIDVPCNVASFDVLFESLSFVAPGKNKYAYRIEGVHQDWIYTNKHDVTFMNLSPGEYVFEVKASNNDGYWSENTSKLIINVLPAFYETIYAKVIYVSLLLLVIYLFVRSYFKRLEKKREYANKNIEQIAKQELFDSKIAFFTQVAHEIKTPVTLIKAPLENIISIHKWNDEVENNLQIIQKNTFRLLELIKQLLDFRKAEKELYTLSYVHVDVNLLIDDIAERFNSITLNGITITTSYSNAETFCNVDKEALTKVISNLLTNAMKYAKSKIAITVDGDNSAPGHILKLSVKDDGPGIAPSEAEKVFEPFYQTETLSKAKSGVGIGLSLVRFLVKKHNGSVYVNNKCQQGCEICIEIPYLKQSIPSMSPLETKEEMGLAQESVQDKENVNILVVEDTQDMLEFLSNRLKDTYNVFMAGDGIEALNVLEMHSVDVIISDIMMPKMDGFELLKSVKSNETLCHIPFILLSALDNEKSKIKGLDFGAEAYIEKPFSVEQIKAMIRSLLENRKMLFKKFSMTPSLSYDKASMRSADVKWLERINKIITDNFTNDEFSIDTVAEEMSVSRSNLQRKIKGLTGMPPNDYVRLIRLKTAAELLKSGKYRINEVCYIVGFNNPSYFARCFLKQFGILPKDYAKNNNGE